MKERMRKVTTEDKCEDCNNEAEHVALLENEEDYTKSYTKKLCSRCLKSCSYAVIDSWTLDEWKSKD